MTKQRQLIDALLRTGKGVLCTNAKTRKYIVLRDIPTPEDRFWYVGKSGALRVGSTVGSSISVTESGKKNLLALAIQIQAA